MGDRALARLASAHGNALVAHDLLTGAMKDLPAMAARHGRPRAGIDIVQRSRTMLRQRGAGTRRLAR